MKILLATDGSKFSLAAARRCSEFLNLDDDTAILIVYVIETITPAEPFGMTDEYLAIARQATQDVAQASVKDTRQLVEDMAPGVQIETRIVDGNPKQTLVREAERWKADLIVAGSHGRGFWGRMFLGSVSAALTRHAGCSVLIVRPEID